MARHPEAFDAVLIGAGQANNPLSRSLAGAGKRVALIERDKIGGTVARLLSLLPRPVGNFFGIPDPKRARIEAWEPPLSLQYKHDILAIDPDQTAILIANREAHRRRRLREVEDLAGSSLAIVLDWRQRNRRPRQYQLSEPGGLADVGHVSVRRAQPFH